MDLQDNIIKTKTKQKTFFFYSGRSCGSAGEVLNGDVQYPTGNEFGDKAIIVCNTGLVWKSLFMVWVDLYFAKIVRSFSQYNPFYLQVSGLLSSLQQWHKSFFFSTVNNQLQIGW